MSMWLAVALGVAVVALAIALMAPGHARRLIRERHLRIERFKLARKHDAIAADVFASPRVQSAIAEWAKQRDAPTAVAERTARQYFREIVPKFNLLAYYRVGAPVARVLLNLLYRVVVNRGPIRRFAERSRKGVVVYVINHRSNADYVLVAHMLFKFISLSYAVGEWARVWPLNHLFKWFGAYFIRRRFREPLYHAVLSEFVATITRRGVTQGIFIEGGLTRDGAWQKPKLGMLDYVIGSKRDPRFTEPLYLVPTAINYDRVLEDRVLTAELKGAAPGGPPRTGLGTLVFLAKNALRVVFGTFRRYGYAIVSFGEPLLVDEAVRRRPDLLAASFDERKSALQEIAVDLMGRISAALPMTPVTLVAQIFRAHGDRALSEAEILRAIEAEREQRRERVWLIREHAAADIWRAARRVLELRRLVELGPAGWRWNPAELLLRDYYANALVPFDEARITAEAPAPRSPSP